jgi:hypothetical protein
MQSHGEREQMEEHAKECMFKVFSQEEEISSACPAPGCGVGKQKKKHIQGRISLVKQLSLSFE